MIGVFDSGLGGLTVLKELINRLPAYNYIYLGDNARAPYGNKSQELIYKYTKQAVDFLFANGCQLIIIACNSASSQALRKIQQDHLQSYYPQKKVLGVVRPLVERVASTKNIKRVGVIGTRATISSNVYKKEITSFAPNLKIYQQSAPLLVPLIEEGWLKKVETKMILRKYLRPLKQAQVEALLLGCTHYPFLLREVQEIMTKRCQVYAPGKVVADSLAEYLKRHKELTFKQTKNKNIKFYTTDEVNNFKILGEKFLNKLIVNIERIYLE